jgi:hypothetical protein
MGTFGVTTSGRRTTQEMIIAQRRRFACGCVAPYFRRLLQGDERFRRRGDRLDRTWLKT